MCNNETAFPTIFELIFISNNSLALLFGTVGHALTIYFSFIIKSPEIVAIHWILAMYSGIAFIESLNLYSLQLGVHVVRGQMAIVSFDIPGINIKNTVASFILFVFLFCSRIVFLPATFMYRYGLICRKPNLVELFQTKKVVFCVVPGVVICILLCTPVYIGMRAIKKILLGDEYVQMLCSVTEIEYISDKFYLVEIFFAVLVTLLIISYVVISYLSYKIFETIQEGALSSRTKALQKQLTYVLLIQAISPLIFTVIPMVTFLVILFWHVEAADYGSISFELLSWQPAVNAVIFLYFVKPFRTQLLGICNRKTKNSSQVAVVDNVTPKNVQTFGMAQLGNGQRNSVQHA